MLRSFAWTALPVLLACPAAIAAQPVQPGAPVELGAAPELPVEFSADRITYDSDADVVTASGAVRMSREGNYLAADQVIWNRKTGEVRAQGNVVLLTPEGDKLVGDNVLLTDTLRDGTVDNLLVVLETGGRIAATRGTRSGQVTTFENAIYSPCPVTSATGCPRRPSWSITAARVIDDPVHKQVRFQGGRLQLFGVNLPLLPIFSISTDTGGTTGWLVPDFSYSTRKGFEVAVPYHWQIASNRDFTVTPHLYTGVWPALEAKYRHLDQVAAFQVGGFLTYGRIESADITDDTPSENRGLRAYVEANGKAQFDPLWSLTASLR
ncbi:MAG: LPS-assembly protein LptD, partial [Sphingomicrobium sp.]